MKKDILKKDEVTFISLDNECGMNIVLSTFGASIYDLKTIDINNKMESVLITPTNLNDFYQSDKYFGKIVGRHSGRIDKGVCEIDGVKYNLDINWNNVNCNHGGFKGLSYQNFNYDIKDELNSVLVEFKYFEEEGNLPGDVDYKIVYEISKNSNDFTIHFYATTSKKTIINLTNHAYFNLSGDGKDLILNHKLYLPCSKYTRLNNDLITLSIDDVTEVMDFRSNHEIGKYIYDESLQNHIAKGYDHCFIKDSSDTLSAILKDEVSGRILNIYSSYPAVVFYSGCYPADFKINSGFNMKQYHGLCLECQYIPNGVNMDNVDKALFDKDEEYYHFIKYEFITL